MKDKDQYLREQAFKGGRFSVAERVVHTPIDERKALVWLVNHLHKKELLTLDDIDDLLFDARPLSEQ